MATSQETLKGASMFSGSKSLNPSVRKQHLGKTLDSICPVVEPSEELSWPLCVIGGWTGWTTSLTLLGCYDLFYHYLRVTPIQHGEINF